MGFRGALVACSLLCVTPAAAGEGYDGLSQPFSWTGFYGGLHGGYATNSLDYAYAGTPEQDLDGGIFGAQVGYQRQFAGSHGIVLGIETDVSFGKLNTMVRDGNYITESGEIDALGTVRARVGLAAGRFMPYITGGLLWARLEQGQECPAPAAAPFGFCNTHGPYNVSETKLNTGWVVGGGFEQAISERWSIRAEALYGELGETTYHLGPDGNGDPLPDVDVSHDMTLLRFGLNGRF